MFYVCIDESGDTGHSKKSSKHFVMCAVVVDDLDSLRRIARHAHRRIANKKKRSGLHAYAEDDATRNRIVKRLLATDAKIVAWVIDKSKTKEGDMYLATTERIAEYFSDQEVEIIVVAKRDTRASYNEKITRIYELQGLKSIFADPTKDKSLQIADFCSWSTFVKFEKEVGRYFEKLKGRMTIL